MVEKVGICIECSKTIYCIDGFLNGKLNDQSELFCFQCFDDSNISDSKIRD